MKTTSFILALLFVFSLAKAQKIYQSGSYESRGWTVKDTIKGKVVDKYFNKQCYWLSIKNQNNNYRINVVDTAYFNQIVIDQLIAIPVHKRMWTNAWKKKK
ncbi:hypothetical protein VRU48_03270 [Pedobacter sp. KR3-3]|uniref:Uncharacterized protein n=1 Tax=Pedobacter albus TaxID=3113905 RepID=A0ABU7I3S4_9SPHI|nr:hypothetical protein [Pedobacter sp. KR3-3]MEE1944113.1 hypothetical protein [Pedobacter sp. KR3-3]